MIDSVWLNDQRHERPLMRWRMMSSSIHADNVPSTPAEIPSVALRMPLHHTRLVPVMNRLEGCSSTAAANTARGLG